MRKVKFTQDSFDEKLGAILTEFPMLDVRYAGFFDCLSSCTLTLHCKGFTSFLVLAHECAL